MTGYYGEVLAEGKTKRILSIAAEPGMVLLAAKDDITAGDGAKRDIIPGKAKWATTTTCNVFRTFKRVNPSAPVAFVEQVDDTRFKAKQCTMLPFEVVIRRAAYGSYLKRHPEVEKGKEFHELKCEFFLKTTGKRFGGHEFPVDDPLANFEISMGGRFFLYDPRLPFEHVGGKSYLMQIPAAEIVDPSLKVSVITSLEQEMYHWWLLRWMEKYASQAFEIIEEQWKKLGGRLVDWKVEFGVDADGNLLLADVIDNDSWRVIMNGEHIDKQRYRDGSSLEDVADRYKYVAELTSRFS
jgi:phosphoribosylaminoimidazole carboxylase/phosphoribosylaminoimidazole-succinocarboxamide synthase